jgi:hypothetical protein
VNVPLSRRMKPTSSTGAWCSAYKSLANGSKMVPRCMSRVGWTYSTRPVMRSAISVSVSPRLVSFDATLPVAREQLPHGRCGDDPGPCLQPLLSALFQILIDS